MVTDRLKFYHVTHCIEAIDANLFGSTFSNVNLTGASLNDVNLLSMSISDACMTGVTIRDANLASMSIAECQTNGMTINGILVEDLLAAYRAKE